MGHPRTSLQMEAYRLIRAGRFADALPMVEQLVERDKSDTAAHPLLATNLFQLGRRRDAERVIADALKCGVTQAEVFDALAHVSLLLGQHERANALYRNATELEPCNGRYWYNLASTERSLGLLDEAELACDRAIALDPENYASYLLRSELRVQSQNNNHVRELLGVLTRRSADRRARVVLGYALAKEFDDLRRFDEAFQWFADAAATHRRHLEYDVRTDELKLRRIAEAYSSRTSGPTRGTAGGKYVFIVGLPRSGTTLLERILPGLPKVKSNGETENFSRALLAAAPSGSQDVFERAAKADPAAVAANYESLADDTEASHIVEKLPMNYLYLGAIRSALPDTKILVVQRSPIDSCFAMYRTLFGAAYPFTYSFSDLARYFAAYRALMSHWRSIFGNSMFEVVYEDFVQSPNELGEQVAAYCNLQWNADAVNIQQNRSASFTASAAQIRQPIYTSACGRWRNYQSHLQPLIELLGKAQ
jgi:Tfp pilus assembly protein PilF